MSKRRRIATGVLAMLLSCAVTLAAMIAADLYLHHRAERSAGLNRWGYRGPVLGRKQPGERRVAMLGGSTMFGYGSPWFEAIPALLEGMINQANTGRPVHVINLGYNNEGAFAFLPTLEDFADLDYDVVCLYEGYNDMMGDGAVNRATYRHNSPVFRLTGYYPILPSVLNEKALALRHGGDLDAAYRAERGEGGTTVFHPSVTDRTSAAALEAVVSVSGSLSRQLARVASQDVPAPRASETGCAVPWTNYCESVYRAVRYSLDRQKRVLVVAQPRLLETQLQETQQRQQHELSEMLRRQFSEDRRVAYVDLSGAVDLSDRNYAFDNVHLGLDGNRVMAAALVEPVQRMLERP